jgi:transcription antitermination protein NusB
MGARTESREAALQMLFAWEANERPIEQVIASFWRETPGDPEGRPDADDAVRGVIEHLGRLDDIIQKASTNWRLSRMARVDRNLLRLGTWELFYRTDVPHAVVLDEAVEIAKRFGSEDSGAFINGVLDRIADEARARQP